MMEDVKTLAREILQQLSYITTHTSRTSELLATGVTNNVLEVSTKLIPAEGYLSYQWQATCGSVEVHNHGSNSMSVQGSMSGTASYQGVGVSRIGTGLFRTVPINARYLTVYGTAGDAVGIVAYTTRERGNGLTGVDGGAP